MSQLVLEGRGSQHCRHQENDNITLKMCPHSRLPPYQSSSLLPETLKPIWPRSSDLSHPRPTEDADRKSVVMVMAGRPLTESACLLTLGHMSAALALEMPRPLLHSGTSAFINTLSAFSTICSIYDVHKTEALLTAFLFFFFLRFLKVKEGATEDKPTLFPGQVWSMERD